MPLNENVIYYRHVLILPNQLFFSVDPYLISGT